MELQQSQNFNKFTSRGPNTRRSTPPGLSCKTSRKLAWQPCAGLHAAWAVALLWAAPVHAGTDGAMDLIYDQQLEPGNVDQVANGDVTDIDTLANIRASLRYF